MELSRGEKLFYEAFIQWEKNFWKNINPEKKDFGNNIQPHYIFSGQQLDFFYTIECYDNPYTKIKICIEIIEEDREPMSPATKRFLLLNGIHVVGFTYDELVRDADKCIKSFRDIAVELFKTVDNCIFYVLWPAAREGRNIT